MGYNELELELRKVLSLIERWRTLGYIPTIEQGVALERMQRAYVELLDMPCGGEAEGATAEAGATAAHGMEWSAAEDHEVMQGMAAVGSGVVAAEASWVVDEADDFAAGKAVGTTESETVQPDAESGMAYEVDETAVEAVKSSEPQEESETEPVAGGDASEEVRVEEVAAEMEAEAEEEHSVHAEPDAEAAQEPEPSVEVLEESVTETTVEVTPEAPVAELNADAQTESASAPEEPASKPEPEAEPAPAPKPQLPRIFGIEVSPYTRHEIIDTLFHGNTEMFEAEVAKLNAMGSLEEALVYIGETYHWIPENAATVKFIDLLETRFDS